MREGRKTVTNDQVGLFHLHEWKFLRRTQRMCGSKWKVVLCTPYEKCYSSSKNLKKLPYDPATSLIGIYPKELKAGSWRAICTLIFIAAWFTLVKKWKWSQVSIDRWVNKQVWYTHTMEYYSAIKRILTHPTSWINLRGHFAKWNKPDTQRKTLLNST